MKVLIDLGAGGDRSDRHPVRPHRQDRRRHGSQARHRPGDRRGAGRRGCRHHRRQRHFGARRQRRPTPRWRPPAATSPPTRCDFADRGAVVELGAELGGAPSRHPGQQRGDDRTDPRRRAPARDVGPRAVGEPGQPVRADPGRRAVDDRARLREDHLHRVAAELPGRRQRPGLRGVQVRDRRAHQGAGQRVDRRSASTSTPSRRATSRPTTPKRCRTIRRAEPILERIPAGRWGSASDLGGAAVFLAARLRTTSPASCCPSTVAGSDADESALPSGRVVPGAPASRPVR